RMTQSRFIYRLSIGKRHLRTARYGGRFEEALSALIQVCRGVKNFEKIDQPDQLAAESTTSTHQIPNVKETFGHLVQQLFTRWCWGFLDYAVSRQPVKLR